MPRFPALLSVVLILVLGAGVQAQDGGLLRVGDPPAASLIEVSAPDEEGIVTITGAAGAVFPGAQVAIRNLYTEQLAYAQAGVTGAFSARIFGPGNTPFWISPAQSIPLILRDRPGSLPGGPGTIIYGGRSIDSAEGEATTQIVIDGSVADWSAYPEAALMTNMNGAVYGLRNTESLYIALQSDAIPETYWKMYVIFTLEGASYRLSLDPRLPEEAATLHDISPIERDRGTIGAVKTQSEAIEIRMPLESLRTVLGAAVETASLDRLEFVAADGSGLYALPILQPLPPVEEIDGIVQTVQIEDPLRFVTGGPLAQGASTWSAAGAVNGHAFAPGDTLHLQLDVTMNVPDFPESLAGVSMVGVLSLQPLNGPDGLPVTGGLNSNNGWSTVFTSSGLPIDNLRSDFVLGETIVPAPQVTRRGETLVFALNFEQPLPETLPAGMYGLIFKGYGQISDGERFAWESNSLLGTGSGISRVHTTRLPVVMTIGEPAAPRLVWTLFQDHPSEGSRGIVAEEDEGAIGLSNRIRFNSPTYILPPSSGANADSLTYPLEPYLINQMPNATGSTSAPLIPFFLPGGQLSASVTKPDGTVDNLERVTILQNRLSTMALEDRLLFGGQSQVDIMRLTTRQPAYTDYRFDQYGPHTIELRGTVEDIWGNQYEGGGTYHVLIAQLLDMQPGVLPGTPFEVGDTFYPGLTLLPGVAADVTVTARIYPLDGSDVIEHEITGQANRYGYFNGEGFALSAPGEYVVDYEARFTDSQGRLWAASTRSAGVIANPQSALIAHGQRGLNGYTGAAYRPAWFTTRSYGPADEIYRLRFPYHSGDVLWYLAGDANTVEPDLTVQDTAGSYARWSRMALAGYRFVSGETVDERAVQGELPVFMVSENRPGYNPVTQAGALVNDAYTYVSVVRPGMSVRQFVLGSNDGSLPLHWDTADPYNGQIGAGLTGDKSGDYAFMFGGVVIRNEAAEIEDTAIYGATAFVIADGFESPGARVFPPYRGASGGADGGPLLTVRDEPITMFFHPTGVRPGQVLELGDTLAVAGNVAPALASEVMVTITSPSGEQRTFNGTANAIGYFYDPTQDLTVDEQGIWRVRITTQHTGLTSAGLVEPPYPSGGILGAADDEFSVYVVSPRAAPLDWSVEQEDIAIPGALPFNFNFDVPDDWVNPVVEHTVTIPGYILRSGPLNASGSSFNYQHNPTNLNDVFPNIEIDARLDGPAATDPVTFTFAVTDETGRIRVRTFTILYDRLLSLQPGGDA